MKTVISMAVALMMSGLFIAPASAESGDDALTPNPLVERTLKSTEGNGVIVVLEGYVGPSSEDVVRLYDDLTLARYHDIPRSDVVEVSRLGTNDADPVKLYVKGTAMIVSSVRHAAAQGSGLRHPEMMARGGHVSGHWECIRIGGETRCEYVTELLQ